MCVFEMIRKTKRQSELPFLGFFFPFQEKKIFQIPWMHAARHGWDVEKDAPLFRNWAIHTGTGALLSYGQSLNVCFFFLPNFCFLSFICFDKCSE